MVFDLDTFAFKRGWGAYGHELSEIDPGNAARVYAIARKRRTHVCHFRRR